MIKYEGTENRYHYNIEDINKIIELLRNGNYYDIDYCTQENVSTLVDAISTFLSNIREEKETTMLERHETEEEARTYFGPEFVAQFDELMTTLDRDQTVVAIHGTSLDTCPKICETGLQYRSPMLSSTAVTQHMEFGQRDIHYADYEGLLNWGHREYKGLVIVAIPYECYYREGLWERFRESNTVYGGQDYRINPDFIVGYIDVEGKQIHLNPRYRREHDYTSLMPDMQLFRENKDMDNERLREAAIKTSEEIDSFVPPQPEETPEEQIDIERIPYMIDEFLGLFNSIKNGFPEYMNESKYRSVLERLQDTFEPLRKAIPLLKTNAEVEEARREREAMFERTISSGTPSEADDDWDLIWDDEFTVDDEDESFIDINR